MMMSESGSDQRSMVSKADEDGEKKSSVRKIDSIFITMSDEYHKWRIVNLSTRETHNINIHLIRHILKFVFIQRRMISSYSDVLFRST